SLHFLFLFFTSYFPGSDVNVKLNHMESNRILILFLVLCRCECARGWAGPDCGDDEQECASSPCYNGAQCVESDVPGEFSCTCPPFFTGPLCRTSYDPCDLYSDPCLHNSTCSPRFRCSCPPGFFGALCDLDVDECEISPCLHDGVCINQPGNFMCCLCSGGYMGSDCGSDIDECCGSRPCLNGGSCVDLLDKYACICIQGYSGKHCELDLDVCLQKLSNFSLCFNGGTCVDGPGSNFTCR
uniref:EGF-like domain-containing protein n=1 Tax=Astyanax mexicanus TaxID=7994 RepID=A0A3B1INB4_ASTMX